MRLAARLLIFLLLVMPASVSAQRTIQFSGYEWHVRRTDEAQGPGPNLFLDTQRAVRSDETGALHLRIWNRGDDWHSAEVRLLESLGYGTYHFQTEGRLEFQSPLVILGLFLYDHTAPEENHREIDIEFGRFGDPDAPAAQFAVQPFATPGNRYQFDLPVAPVSSGDQVITHAIRWQPGALAFRAAAGDHADLFRLPADDPHMIAAWDLAGESVPAPGAETVHMNLWLYRGRAPEEPVEVVIRRFWFTPAPPLSSSGS